MLQSKFWKRSREPEGGSPGLRAGDVRLEEPLLDERGDFCAPRDHHDLRVAVERPGVEVHGAEADDVVGDDDLRVDDRVRELPHLDASPEHVGVAVLQRGGRLRVVGRLRDDDPHPHPALRGGNDPVDHPPVGEIGVHHVEALPSAVDLLPDRLRGGHVPAGDHLCERDGRRAGVGRLREERRQLGRKRRAVAVEARQERRLRLPDDIAGDPHHHVMEAAVLEMVLDARATRPRNRAVDHVELAVIGPADLVLPPIDPLAVGVEAVPVEREDVVDDDLRSGGGEAREHLARLLVRPGPDTRPRSPGPRRPPSASAPGVLPSSSRSRPRASRTSGCAPSTARPRHRRRSSGRSSRPPPTARSSPRSTTRTEAPRRAGGPHFGPRTPPSQPEHLPT